MINSYIYFESKHLSFDNSDSFTKNIFSLKSERTVIYTKITGVGSKF